MKLKLPAPDVTPSLPIILPLILTAVLVQGLWFSNTPADWWFEDDTPHRVFVRDHTSIPAYFGPELVSALSLGNSVTPWFTTTFRLDYLVHSESAVPAYWHSLIAVWLTACMLFLVLFQWIGDWRPSLAAAMLWPFMPAVVVTMEFLSTRHYMEGLLFSLIAFYLGKKAVAENGDRRLFWAAAGFYLLACTAKEVFVTGTWWVLVCLYLATKHYRAVGGMFVCGLLYTGYRLLCLPAGGKAFTLDFLQTYYLFPLRLPYMFTGNYGGYAFAALFLVLLGLGVAKKQLSWRHLFFIVGGLGVMAVTILPVSEPVTLEYKDTGTWYRVITLFCTFILGTLTWLIARVLPQRAGLVTLLIAIPLFLWGGWAAAERWDSRKAGYTADGRFYLANPDKLLYSKEPAPWFLYGLHRLHFPGQERHYLSWRVDNGTPADYIRARLDQYDTVWVRDENGNYVADKELWRTIGENLEKGITPLHR